MKLGTKELRKMGYRKMMLAQSQIADELDRLYAQEAKGAETIAKLRKAIEDTIKHQETIGGSLSKMSVTTRILEDALNDTL